MSDPRLPPEILDYIVDFLHKKPQRLKMCCLVAKSWVPRTRKHLFNKIEISSLVDLETWWKVFPDPDSSPGHHVRSLIFPCVGPIFSGVAGGCNLVRPFTNVVRLGMWCDKGIFNALTSSQFFELVCSLPLLEDIDLGVWVIGSDYEHGPVFEPRASPPLAGTLSLSLAAEIGDVTRGLLALSNGIHFRKFVFAWSSEEDYQWAMALVERCSDTLEYVEIGRNVLEYSSEALIDLSNATKLREVAFWFRPDVNWITNTLKTILLEHKDLQKISIYFEPHHDIFADDPEDLKRVVGEWTYKQWMDLDGRLVQLWEAHAVCIKLVGARNKFKSVISLLPETAKRGILQLLIYAEVEFDSKTHRRLYS